MPALSINLNKVALLRNSRGRGLPDLLAAADLVLRSGADGITLHPRRDQRHVRFDDLRPMADHLAARWPGVELNIECEDDPAIVDRVLAIRPAQCTLVPVSPNELTSDHGWDLTRDHARVAATASRLAAADIRVSAFADCVPETMARFAEAGVDRVELYTGPYAWTASPTSPERDAVWASASAAVAAGLGVNAGHDLDRYNLVGLRGLPGLAEVSIGHAVICRALEVGYPAAIAELKAALATTGPTRAS